MKLDLEKLYLLKQIYQLDNSYYDAEAGCSLYRLPAGVSQADLDRLDLAPNHIISLSHNRLLEDFKSLADRWTIDQAATAYLSAFASADYSWQAILLAKVLARHLPAHDFEAYGASSSCCKICGFNDQALNETEVIYRAMTGGPATEGNIQHLFLTLRYLADQPLPQPSQDDLSVFKNILSLIRQAPAGKSFSYIRDQLKKAKLFANPSVYVISGILENMALMGLLDTEDHPGLWESFTTYIERDSRPSVRIEVQAPLAWWTTTEGLNEAHLAAIFPAYDFSAEAAEAWGDLPQADFKDNLIYQWQRKRLPRKSSPKSPHAGSGPAQAGDVYAIRMPDQTWLTVYCHQIQGSHVLLEVLQGRFSNFPSQDQLILKIKTGWDGRHFQQKTSGLDRTSGVRRIARNKSLSQASPLEDFPPFGSIADLKRKADYFFSWEKD